MTFTKKKCEISKVELRKDEFKQRWVTEKKILILKFSIK